MCRCDNLSCLLLRGREGPGCKRGCVAPVVLAGRCSSSPDPRAVRKRFVTLCLVAASLRDDATGVGPLWVVESGSGVCVPPRGDASSPPVPVSDVDDLFAPAPPPLRSVLDIKSSPHLRLSSFSLPLAPRSLFSFDSPNSRFSTHLSTPSFPQNPSCPLVL